MCMILTKQNKTKTHHNNKGNIDEFYYFKLRNLCSSEDLIRKVRVQSREENLFFQLL